MPETAASGEPATDHTAPASPPADPQPASMISVDLLTAHPGNAREDLALSPEFAASVAEAGVRIPLLVTTHENGSYVVIEGHRRLAAAVKAGLAEVPCVLDASRAGDTAGQILDMVIANGDGYRRNFSLLEEAAALFAAHEAGATRTRIRRATGRKTDEVKTALAAGGLSGDARAAVGAAVSQLTLEDLALLAEFDGDQGAISRIVAALDLGQSVEYVAERIRQDQAEMAQHARLVLELATAGIAVTTDLPAGAVRLGGLLHDGGDLTEDTHAACPGRAVYFPSWSPLHPVHYCTSPGEHGHTLRTYLPPPGAQNGTSPAPPAPSLDGPGADVPPDLDRRLVIEGNKAWAAAAKVRRRWLPQLFARRASPREVARFVAEQLLAMPAPLRQGLAPASLTALFPAITALDPTQAAEGCTTWPAVRLPLLMLAPIAAAYEGAMYGTEAARGTWRTGKYTPCPRPDAGRYLRFLAATGYPLSVIEQAVADGVPYTGDTPPEPAPADPTMTISGDTASDDPNGDAARENPGPAARDGSQDSGAPAAA